MTSPRPPLFDALDELGFAYTVRRSTAGTPYAGFRWQGRGDGPLRSYTALAEAGGLRLTAHGLDLAADEPPLAARLERQAQLPVARLGRDDDGRWALTLAVPTGEAALEGAVLHALLDHLRAGVDAVEGRVTGAARRPPSLAACGDEGPLDEVLRGFGLSPERDAGASVVDLRLGDDDRTGRFSLYHLGTGWLRAAARSPGDELDLHRLEEGLVDRLQQWAPAGRYVALPGERGGATLGCEVAAPCLGRPVPEVVADIMGLATRLLAAALRQADSDPT